jgi:hypothetical protein
MIAAHPSSTDAGGGHEPAPPSTASTLGQVHTNEAPIGGPPSPQLPPHLKYEESLKELRVHLPYVGLLLYRSRHKFADLKLIDWYDTGEVEESELKLDLRTPESITQTQSDLEAMKTNIDQGVMTRLLLVQDLSQHLVTLLGSCFGLSATFFAEHPVNSGYRNGLDEDESPLPWSTGSASGDHVSVKWYRPVARTTRLTWNSTKREKTLSSEGQTWQTSNGGSLPPIDYRSKAVTNILRAEWSLQDDTKCQDHKVFPLDGKNVFPYALGDSTIATLVRAVQPSNIKTNYA